MTHKMIVADHLSKRYRISDHGSYTLLRDAITNTIARPFRRGRSEDSRYEYIWAVNDVSFDIRASEIVGIIGRNGAGKSTLLKILAQITKPTKGHARIGGSVGSLLEVGTGFHPELTGRDNLYMNGAILGMRRAEIARKFSEIVEFAGVEKFIDTPVKRYSSGMQVRLAFAVAAHLEPQILLVDEVLAVGDADFQKRCFGRMQEVTEEGRTILFVSHNMPSVMRLCPRVIFMESGRVVADGPSHEVIRAYLDTGLGTMAHREWPEPSKAPGDEVVRIKAIRVLCDGAVTEKVDIRKPVDVEVEYWYLAGDDRMRPGVGLHFINEEGVRIFASTEYSYDDWKRARVPGVTKARCRIPGNFLAEGQLTVHAVISTLSPSVTHVGIQDAVAFHVVDTQEGGSVRAELTKNWPGVVRPLLDWAVEDEPDPGLVR